MTRHTSVTLPAWGEARYQRLHNPHNRVCGCDAGLLVPTYRRGRAVKWWFPARYVGLHHKSSFFSGMTPDEIREWKREHAEEGMHRMVSQPQLGRFQPGSGRCATA